MFLRDELKNMNGDSQRVTSPKEKVRPGQARSGRCEQNRMAAAAAAIEASYQNGGRLELNPLVAIDHVLGDSLQANNRVSDQGQAPELAMALTQPVGGRDRRNALHRGNRVSSAHRRMCAI